MTSDFKIPQILQNIHTKAQNESKIFSLEESGTVFM